MDTNVNFSNDLKVGYLSDLALRDYRDEFLKIYQSMEEYIKDLVNRTKDLATLEKLKRIVSYRTSLLEKKV